MMPPRSWKQQAELFPSVTDRQFAAPNLLSQQLGQLQQHLIAEAVAMRVIDAFEVVEVDQHDTNRIAAALRRRCSK